MIKNWKEFDLSEELYNEPKEGEEKPSKETGFFSTLTFQVILCLAITIILVLLNTFFPSQYHDIDSELKTLIQEDGGFAEDMEGIKSQFERWLNKEQATILPDVGESSTDINSTEEYLKTLLQIRRITFPLKQQQPAGNRTVKHRFRRMFPCRATLSKTISPRR